MRAEYGSCVGSLHETEWPGASGEWPYACADACVGSDKMWMCTVGLCRAYRVRAGAVEQMTEDDSLLNDYERSLGRKLDAAELEAFPHKSISLGSLGQPRRSAYRVVEDSPRAGDAYVLCTPEVHRCSEAIARLPQHIANASLSEAAQSLWDDALRNRPPDEFRRAAHFYEAQAAIAIVRL